MAHFFLGAANLAMAAKVGEKTAFLAHFMRVGPLFLVYYTREDLFFPARVCSIPAFLVARRLSTQLIADSEYTPTVLACVKGPVSA